MYSRRTGISLFALVALSFVLSAAFYGRLPETMATHWNQGGYVDGTASKFWGAFTLPFILTFLLLLFSAIPFLKPVYAHLPEKNDRINAFLVVLFAFFNAIHLQVLLWNAGTEISFAITVPILIGILFFVIGWMLDTIEPNWVVGIRTYWTLKSATVWRMTHQRGSKLFRILGVIYLFAVFFRDYILFFILLPAIFVALYLVAYSFLLYQKLEK